jgi:hypothetical protein
MFNDNSNPIVTNCIFWGDEPNEITNANASSPTVTYSDVQGGWPGEGNIDADPCFGGGDALMMGRMERWDYLLSSASPCVDAGDNSAPNLAVEDMGGESRIIDGDVDGNSVVDMGAYELQPCVRNVTQNRWYQLIYHSIIDANEGDEIVVEPGTYYENLDFYNKPNVVLRSVEPNDPNVVEQTIIDAKFGGDVVRFASQGPSCVLAGFTLTANMDAPGAVPGYGIGSYYPSFSTSPVITNCIVRSTRGVYLAGGSAVLSGCTIRDNIGGATVGGNAVVEDCIIASNYGGVNNGTGPSVRILDGDTTITRCVVSGNRCSAGGIDCASGGNKLIEDCVISDNWGWNGGIYASGYGGMISGCTITGNEGRGISDWAGPIENCAIANNVEDAAGIISGGGMRYCTGPITGCVVQGNKALFGGGLADCSSSITNCVIANNAAEQGGGLYACSGPISNCTIVGNVATVSSWPDSGLGGGLYDCNGIISNCIIRQNFAQTDGDQLYSSSVPSYSCIQDWSGGGVGNIAADPCFVYAGYWADFNDPNTVVEPNDPNAVWVDGNYRLRWASPCIDAGDNNSVPADISDLDADGDVNEPVPFDLGGLPRFIEDLCTFDSGNPGTLGPPVVDMGVFEFLPADIDSSGAVNLYDLSMLALHLGKTGCGRCGGANLNCDVKVDFNDLRLLTDWWLAGTKPEL